MEEAKQDRAGEETKKGNVPQVRARVAPQEDESGGVGGGRTLTILLIAAAVIAVVYLVLGRGKSDQDSQSSQTVPTASAQHQQVLSGNHFEVLETLNVDELEYVRDRQHPNLCYLKSRWLNHQAAVITRVPCEDLTPALSPSQR